MKLTDDLYTYEWTNPYENNCNSYYVGGAIQALVDPGLKKSAPDLLEKMARDGIAREDIRYIINTHSHPDHFEASEFFKDADNIKIGLHEKGVEFLRGEGSALYGLFGLQAPEIEIDPFLKEGTIMLGNETLEIIHTPGHSPGSVGIYWPARKALFCGDVIFNQNVGRTDFPGGNSSLLKESIAALSRLDVEFLLPGHMEIIEGKDMVQKNFRTVTEGILPYI